MQRVSALLPSWDRNRSSTGTTNSNNSTATNSSSTHARKSSVDIVRGWADKIPSPVNRLSTSSRLSREAFWPSTLDKECEKAARILKSFCSDGFSTPDDRPGSPSTYSSGYSSNKHLKKIPPRIIQNAVGLAVFTSMRSGLWTSGSGGSGILIARKTDGTWSPPSGLMLQTASLGFVIGVDIYDCILIINNFTVLETLARPKLTLGTDVRLTGGPLVSLGLLENDVAWADLSDTAITYVKAKGQCSEVKLDGTILNERSDENERFYGMKLGVAKILAGDINQSLPQTRSLTEVLKAAEGRNDYDTALVEQLSAQPAPGDATIESPNSGALSPAFGIPDAGDPDPFGVVALEMAGLEIREAGSRLRPESNQFDFHPSPTSPIFSKVAGRQSVDTYLSRSNRGSYMSSRTMATERSHLTDAGTQTFSGTPETTPSPSQSQSEDGNQHHSGDDIPEVKEPEEVDYTKIDISALRKLSNFPDLDDEPTITNSTTENPELRLDTNDDSTKSITAPYENEKDEDADDEGEEGSLRVEDAKDDEDEGSVHAEEMEDEKEDGKNDDDDEEEEFDDDDEDAVVFEVATAQAPPRMAVVASQVVQAKGAVVNIPRRVPPPLPTRSPARASRRRSQMGDISSIVGSPLRQQFEAESEVAGALTPKATNSATKPVKGITDEAPSKKVESHDARESGSTPATPTQESNGRDDYFPKVGERSPLRETKAVTQTSTTTEEQVDFNPGHGVPVSVA